MKNSAKLQKQFNKIWNGSSFDPWKQQIIIDTTNGEQMLILLNREDRQWHLMPGLPTMVMEDITGLKAIEEKVNQMITSGEVADIYPDYQ